MNLRACIGTALAVVSVGCGNGASQEKPALPNQRTAVAKAGRPACVVPQTQNTPAAAVASIDTLQPTLVLAGPNKAYVRSLGGRASFAEIGSTDILVYDTSSATPTARVKHPAGPLAPSYAHHRFVRDGVLFLNEGVLFAFDAVSGAAKWQRPLLSVPPLSNGLLRVAHVELHRDGDRVVGTLSAITTNELISIDWNSGDLKWRRTLNANTVALEVEEGRIFVLGADYHVRAFSAKDGKPLWSRKRPASTHEYKVLGSLSAASGLLVTAYYDGAFEVLDAASGKLCSAPKITGHIHSMARLQAANIPIAGRDAYFIVSRPGSNHLHEHLLTAVDITTGKVRWQSSPLPYPDESRGSAGQLFVDVDSVYTCMGDGTLRAFARSTGRLTWQWGIGHCGLAALDPDSTGAAQFITRIDDDWVMFSRGDNKPLPPLERVTIEGRVQKEDGTLWTDAPVVVHDKLVVTDSNGRFAVTTRARGRLYVRLKEPRFQIGGRVSVVLDGRSGPYPVKLALRPTPPLDR